MSDTKGYHFFFPLLNGIGDSKLSLCLEKHTVLTQCSVMKHVSVLLNLLPPRFFACLGFVFFFFNFANIQHVHLRTQMRSKKLRLPLTLQGLEEVSFSECSRPGVVRWIDLPATYHFGIQLNLPKQIFFSFLQL